jgi:hypothetical protein
MIDATFSPVAVKIGLGQSFNTILMTSISGHTSRRTCRYRQSDYAAELEYAKNDSPFYHKFRLISHAAALRDMTLFAALKKQSGTNVPSSKHIITRQTVQLAPKLIPFVRFGEKSWPMEACRL